MRYLQFTFELFSMLKIMNMQHSTRESFYTWKQQKEMCKAVQNNLVQFFTFNTWEVGDTVMASTVDNIVKTLLLLILALIQVPAILSC